MPRVVTTVRLGDAGLGDAPRSSVSQRGCRAVSPMMCSCWLIDSRERQQHGEPYWPGNFTVIQRPSRNSSDTRWVPHRTYSSKYGVAPIVLGQRVGVTTGVSGA